MIIVWEYAEGDDGWVAYNWGIYNWIAASASKAPSATDVAVSVGYLLVMGTTGGT